MCGLCGLLGQVHWSDTSAHPDAFSDDRRRTIRAERAHRVAVVNTALKPYRMTVSDFQGSCYVLTAPTGRRAIVDDIQAVWGKVDEFLGRPLDPLDPDWLDDLAAVRGQ